MVEALAAGAALAYALGNVLQQRGTLQTSAGHSHTAFLIQILRRPVWVVGLAFQIMGWLLQALALDRGPLTLVQSICTLSIVLALPFGARLTAQRITATVVVGAILTVAGIILFLLFGAPSSGTSNPGAEAWWVTGVGTIVVVGGTSLLARTRTGAPKALLFGTAAGFCFALQAALTKQVVSDLGGGLAAALGHWQLYAFPATALVGFALWQFALRADVLAPAMASSNAASLFGGVFLGITLFGETLDREVTRSGLALVGLATAMLGVVLLSAAPSPVEPESSAATQQGPLGR